jgi:hypothetical protein
MNRSNSDNTPATIATTATIWDEMSRPKTYRDAVNAASQLITARLNADPKGEWRIRIDRPENGPPRIWQSNGLEGRTRAEYFERLKDGNQDGTIEERAMASRLYREQTTPRGKGRPTREQADLQRPAGQSIDAIVYETCLHLKALGWEPLSRANEDGPHTTNFDVVAEALGEHGHHPNSYSGVRAAYYRVSSLL